MEQAVVAQLLTVTVSYPGSVSKAVKVRVTGAEAEIIPDMDSEFP